MSGESRRWWRDHYLGLAEIARGNAARCADPGMADDYLEAACAWQQMADEINLQEENEVSPG
jgi:hypothetical protein